MRKYITIVGIGKRMAGVSAKTNNPYDFTPVSFQYDDVRFTGVRCATANVSADAFGGILPEIGATYECVMREDFKTGRVFVEAIL